MTRNNQSVKVTQMAFPEAVRTPTTNAADGMFADSMASEITTPTGSPSAGYSASFQVGIAG